MPLILKQSPPPSGDINLEEVNDEEGMRSENREGMRAGVNEDWE